MRLIADEDIESLIVEWLRLQHDVVWIAETAPSMPDADILSLAKNDNRVVITADLDFGEMVVRQNLATAGVILLRFRSQDPSQRLNLFRMQWPAIEADAPAHFVVVSDRHMRVRR